jgi:hypothetical protein
MTYAIVMDMVDAYYFNPSAHLAPSIILSDIDNGIPEQGVR